MSTDKFTVNSLTVGSITGLIEAGLIAIPEIQRPFVWRKTQVRDLIDSLYKGYPTGFLITWQNPNVKLKDGSVSAGKKILIDGQQRVTAIMTAISGIPVINSSFKKERIKIAFNPFEAFSNDREAEIFAVQDSSHLKSKKWIPDIAELFKSDFNSFGFITEYCKENPEMNPEDFSNVLTNIKAIENRAIGVIELSHELDIDLVTDIFIRINSKGTVLSQGDFVMSKIAADENHGGNMLRKAIDYFAHMAKDPTAYEAISNDIDFANTAYFSDIKWLQSEIEDVYDPDYDDVLRVAFMHKFSRAKMSDLVSLLSGRDFETKDFKEEIIDDTYEKLKDGVRNVFNKNNFKQFMIALHSAGFTSHRLINSQMALDFAYTLYLILAKSNEVSVGEVKRIVQKWYVLSILTKRYTSSPESAFNKDLRNIHEKGVVRALEDIEAATLSDTFWNVAVPQALDNSSSSNPTYLVYLAAQIKENDISMLSNNVQVKYLVEQAGDVHHIFPKEYLKNNGYPSSWYNSNANYAYLDTQVNKSIGMKAPKVYFGEALEQCDTKEITCGSITDKELLISNLETNCVPIEIFDMDETRYEEFLDKRALLMANKIRKYYESL